MSDVSPDASIEEIARSLRQRAVELWGPARASELGVVIEEAAEHIRRVADDAPAVDEVPGTYN